MRILKLSWPLALLGLRLRIIFPISSAENVIVDKRLSVRYLGLDGSLLVIREYCLEKKLSKSLPFSLKSITKRFS